MTIPILGGFSGLPGGISGLKDPLDILRYVMLRKVVFRSVLFSYVSFRYVSFRICSDAYYTVVLCDD